MTKYRSQQYLEWFELLGIYHRNEFTQNRRGGLGEVPVIASKIAKICGVHAGVPSSGALFFFAREVTNKKTHF